MIILTRSNKTQKLTIYLLIIVILISSYVIILQSINNYFDCLKQSNVYLQKQSDRLNSSSIQRAILIFYPSDQEDHYLAELLWLYRSWIEMMKYESKYWRTDLNIYTGEYSPPLQKLGCILNQVRSNEIERPQCRVFLYLRLSKRQINSSTQMQTILANNSNKNLFKIDTERSTALYNSISTYQYVDSVNILAESYPTYAYYDFILKTDIDVFITKPFAKYLPITNRTLLVGLGGYSTNFNTRRLQRIARDMNWNYQNVTNVGSTWYGSPYIAQRIANLAIDAMLHLAVNEFVPVERQQKLGVLLWPDWHFSVLTMYGTHLAVNHLLASEKVDIKKADELLDQKTTDTDIHDIDKNNRLHLHCWHTDSQFSKFQFKASKYNHMHPRTFIHDTSARGYAMRMALESRLMTLGEFGQRLHQIGDNKTL